MTDLILKFATKCKILRSLYGAVIYTIQIDIQISKIKLVYEY